MWKKQKGFNLARQSGLTLVELVATILILAVLAAMALPNFNRMILNNRSSSLGEDLLFAFNFARSEAVKRATRVSVCASNDGASCTSDTNWQTGFIVYVDGVTTDNDTTTKIAKDATTNEDLILKKWTDIHEKADISVQRNGVDVAFVRFTGLGVLARNDSNAVKVINSIEGCTGDAGRTLDINLAGQLRSSKSACP